MVIISKVFFFLPKKDIFSRIQNKTFLEKEKKNYINIQCQCVKKNQFALNGFCAEL